MKCIECRKEAHAAYHTPDGDVCSLECHASWASEYVYSHGITKEAAALETQAAGKNHSTDIVQEAG